MKKILSILLASLLLAGTGVVAAFAASYTITFHEGENPLGITTTNLPPPMSKDEGIATNLPTQIPLRENYKFKGWAASPTLTAGQKVYAAGEAYNLDETDTLYAIWEDNVCWVTINANTPPGGAVTGLPVPNPVKKFKDTLLSMSAISTAIACTGYTLAGWARSAAGPVTISKTGSIGDQADVTLYAVWEANSFTIAFNANSPGGAVTGMPDPLTKTKIRGTPLTIPETPVVANTNYTFAGWATTSSGAATIPPAGDYTTDAAATLYAVWKGRDITVQYNKNNSSAGGAMADSIAEYGKASALRANTFTAPPLNVFVGWAASADGAKTYSDGQNVTLRPADGVNTVELFAVWEKSPLQKKIEELDALESWKYTAETWAALQKVLDEGVKDANGNVIVRAARVVAADPAATQLEIDNVMHELVLAQRKLAGKSFIFSTKHEATIWNWLMFIFLFGWIWMWFA